MKQIDTGDTRKERERQHRRGEITLNILQALSHGALLVSSLVLAFSPGITPAFARGIGRGHKTIRAFFDQERDYYRFYTFLSYLQKSGLVVKKDEKGNSLWRLTDRGRKKMFVLLYQRRNAPDFLFPLPQYEIIPSDSFTIVIFDIPERERRKREWIRRALQNLTFTMVQKSVWMAPAKLPIQFIKDLKELDLLSCVKVFSALEVGSLSGEL